MWIPVHEICLSTSFYSCSAKQNQLKRSKELPFLCPTIVIKKITFESINITFLPSPDYEVENKKKNFWCHFYSFHLPFQQQMIIPRNKQKNIGRRKIKDKNYIEIIPKKDPVRTLKATVQKEFNVSGAWYFL